MSRSNTSISRAEENGDAARSELSVPSAHFLRIGFRNCLLVISIGRTDDLWQIVLGQGIVQECQIRLIRIRRGGKIRIERWLSPGREGG